MILSSSYTFAVPLTFPRQARLKKLETERKLFKAELKKRELEKTTFLQRITDLSTQLEEIQKSHSSGTQPSAEEQADMQKMLKEMNQIVEAKDVELKNLKEKARGKLGLASAQIKKLKDEYGKIRAAYVALVEKVKSGEVGNSQVTERLEQEKTLLKQRLEATQRSRSTISAKAREVQASTQMVRSSCSSLGKLKMSFHSFSIQNFFLVVVIVFLLV